MPRLFAFLMTAVAAAATTSSLRVRVGSGSDGSNVVVGRGGREVSNILAHCKERVGSDETVAKLQR